MKATTFVLRQHERIDEMIRVLERETHLRAPMLTELVEEVLSFLALEEDLFYPRVAARADANAEVGRAVDELRDRISEEHAALLDLLDAEEDAQFGPRIERLARAIADHARRDRAIAPLVERIVAAQELEEMGTRMARFYRESIGAAADRASDVIVH